MSSWSVEFKPEAKRALAKLPKEAQRQIGAALDRYTRTGAGNVIHLTGRPGEFRLRTGDYRVIFERQGDRLVILVLTVGNRRDVYKG